jgi:preprotein translocase subunit SecA
VVPFGQLIGRCARKGDPGSFEIVASLEVELITVFAPSLKAMLDPARSGHHPLPRSVARVMRWYAQARAQRLHYRRHRATLRLQDELDKSLAFAKPE